MGGRISSRVQTYGVFTLVPVSGILSKAPHCTTINVPHAPQASAWKQKCASRDTGKSTAHAQQFLCHRLVDGFTVANTPGSKALQGPILNPRATHSQMTCTHNRHCTFETQEVSSVGEAGLGFLTCHTGCMELSPTEAQALHGAEAL